MEYLKCTSMLDIHIPQMAYTYNKQMSYNAEIRYFNIFQNLRNRFRSNFACKKEYCPMMKERWEHHMRTEHPELSRHPEPTRHFEDPSDMCRCPKSSHKVMSKQTIRISSCHLRLLETDLDDDSLNTDVRDEIIDLFKDFPDADNYRGRQLKTNLINNLSDKINTLIKDGVLDEEQIKTELDNVINEEFRRYPDKTNKMVSFVNGLSGKIYEIAKSKQNKEQNQLSVSDNESVLGPLQTKSQTLDDELHNIFKDYPLHTSTQNAKQYKDKIIKGIVNDVHGILNDKTIPASVKKTEIENLLDKLNTKYPTSTNEQNNELKNIKSKLYDNIAKGRRNALQTMKRSRSVSSSTSSSQNSDAINYNTRKRVNEINNNVTSNIKKIFNDFPALTQESNKYNKDNQIRELSEDVKKIVARHKLYNKSALQADVDNLIDKMSEQVPVLKKDVKFNNDVKARLFKTIKDCYKDDPRLTINNYNKHSLTDGNVGASGNLEKSGDNSKIEENPRAGIRSNRSTVPYKDRGAGPTFNNYTKDNFRNDIDTSGNLNPRGNSGKSDYHRKNENFLRAGISSSSKMSQSDSIIPTNQVSIRKDPKSELRQILESSIYAQIPNERKDSLINRLFYDIEGIKNSSRIKNDAEIKDKLDKLIEKLPLWYPGAKRDQTRYVNNFKDKLFDFVKNPTQGLRSTSYDKQRNINNYISGLSAIDDSVVTIFTNDNLAENFVRDWVENIKHEAFMTGVDTEDLIKSVTERVVPILQKNYCGKKVILKGAILETFSHIPATFKCNLRLQNHVNELVNNLNYMYRNIPNECCHTDSRTMFFNIYRNFYKIYALKKTNQCLDNTNISVNVTVRDEIADLILHHSDNVSLDDEVELKKVIVKTLTKNTDASQRDIILTAKNITECFYNNNNTKVETDVVFPATKSIAVFTSFTDIKRKEVQRLNDEEIYYMNRVSGLIRAWMDTLPIQFDAPEERGFKESMISELAGELMDTQKYDQIIAFPPGGKDNNLKYHVYKWIIKFNCFDLEELKPSAENFLAKLSEIPVPDLTKSFRGTRQMMDNIKHMEGEKGWKEHYVPRGIDVLEDEISIWVHEQPPDLFTFDNKTRNDKIHELATVVQPKIAMKKNVNVIEQDIQQWLKNNLKTNAYLDELQRNLKDRVTNLPQDATLRRNLEERLEDKLLATDQLEKLKNQPPSAPGDDDTIILDIAMKDFISKFIEHNNDVDDPKARAAFNHLLKRKLQRLTPQSRQAVYDQPNGIDLIVPPNELLYELEYIKLISDWLKSIPVENNFNRPLNRERIDFILGLARTIAEVENERAQRPCGMDYDMYTRSVISTHLRVLPIPEQYKHTNIVDVLASHLVEKLEKARETIKIKMAECFANESGINDENLGDYLEEFIRLHGNDIADDEIKMEAWTIRLIREITNIVEQKGPDVSKAHIYKQMVTVPKPGNETIQRFDTELIYIEKITEWMKNLPFMSLSQEDEVNIKRMICDLAEYLAAKEVVTIEDKELTEYLSQWIFELPLDRSHQIVIPILIEQLIKRINRDYRDEQKHKKLPKQESKVVSKKGSKSKLREDPGTIVVEAVVKWSKSLPLNEDNNYAVQSDAAKKLYQKIGEFNSDPGIYNDVLLYETFLKDQIETIVEKLPNGDEIRVKNEKNNEKLLKTLVDANTVAKEISARESYKQKLEHTMDASIPNPVTNRQTYDPAFEIYKSKLADMFILENFDHGNDQVKTKYERKIRDEIDKYFEGAQHKNKQRLTKDEIYNELYSNLFKVPVPNETSTMEEVEKVKTRQVIDEWFEVLPFTQTDDIIELLEWDKKLDSLTKSIHKIEKSSKSDEKILREITKWLTKMPIAQCQEHRINEFAEILKYKLKSSVKERKCVSEKDAKGKKDKKSKTKSINNISGPKAQKSGHQVQSRAPTTNAGDMIVDVVEQWCSKVDIVVPASTSTSTQNQAEIIRKELVRKITLIISEIHMNTAVFDNDFLYKKTLDTELEKILTEVHTCCSFKKAERKAELIDFLNAIKPLIKEEKDKVNYIKNLNNTVDEQLKTDLAGREDEFNALKEEIVDNYVQLNYDQDDEGKQIYKQKIHDAVDKFLTDIKQVKDSNSLMKRNQLICELNKVPRPSHNVIINEVDEIRMKEQVSEFLEENSLNNVKDKPVNLIKTTLAKKLTVIEASGHTRENQDKMVKVIRRSVAKLNQDFDTNKIEGFVQKLKANETERKRYCACNGLSNIKKTVTKVQIKEYSNNNIEKREAELPGCAKKFQECCPCDNKKIKPVCPRPYTKLQCDPDGFCYKYPEYCP